MSRSVRVAILADYAEEGWPSMDLVAEMLTNALSRLDGIQATLIRPSMPQPFTARFGATGRSLDRLAGRFLHLPFHVKGLWKEFDVFHIADHSYSQLAHYLPPERCVVTCHDLDTFRCLMPGSPERRSWAYRAMTGRILQGLRRAAYVPCVSEATAAELSATGWVAQERIGVTPNGVSDEYFAPPEPEAHRWTRSWLAAQRAEGKPFLLHVGSMIPRKRLDVLLRVFIEVSAKWPELHLVRVGGSFDGEQWETARRFGVEDRIHTAPFLRRSQLRALYEDASLVLQTSSAEGFGLPVAEAQASGAVVVASDIAVLREIGGKAARFCPVGDIEKWTSEVDRLLADHGQNAALLMQRKNESRVWASRYRWDTVARSLSERYQYLMGIMG